MNLMLISAGNKPSFRGSLAPSSCLAFPVNLCHFLTMGILPTWQWMPFPIGLAVEAQGIV